MSCPERTCAVCRNKAEKDAFIRIVNQKNGEISIDDSYKKEGRGMYICRNKECISKAIKTRAVSRVFKRDVGNNIYEDLGNLL